MAQNCFKKLIELIFNWRFKKATVFGGLQGKFEIFLLKIDLFFFL